MQSAKILDNDVYYTWAWVPLGEGYLLNKILDYTYKQSFKFSVTVHFPLPSYAFDDAYFFLISIDAK